MGQSTGHARGLAREASRLDSRRAKGSGDWTCESSQGTLSPAAEDGVRESRAALGAPHQLHQLFSQFGHDRVPASGCWLSGLLPRHMGKGRIPRQEWSGRLTVAPAPPGSVAAAPQRVTHRLPGRLQRGCLPTLGNPRDTPCPRPKRSLGALGICWADFFPDCWGARRE